jgi:hypothetical protein
MFGQQIFALESVSSDFGSRRGAEAAIFLPLSNRVWAQVRSGLIYSFSLLSRFPSSAL